KQQELDEKLFRAVNERKVADVKSMIEAGANVNAHRTETDIRGLQVLSFQRPLLQFALGYGTEEEAALPVIEALLDAGADIDARDERTNNWTPIMHAAF